MNTSSTFLGLAQEPDTNRVRQGDDVPQTRVLSPGYRHPANRQKAIMLYSGASCRSSSEVQFVLSRHAIECIALDMSPGGLKQVRAKLRDERVDFLIAVVGSVLESDDWESAKDLIEESAPVRPTLSLVLNRVSTSDPSECIDRRSFFAASARLGFGLDSKTLPTVVDVRGNMDIRQAVAHFIDRSERNWLSRSSVNDYKFWSPINCPDRKLLAVGMFTAAANGNCIVRHCNLRVSDGRAKGEFEGVFTPGVGIERRTDLERVFRNELFVQSTGSYVSAPLGQEGQVAQGASARLWPVTLDDIPDVCGIAATFFDIASVMYGCGVSRIGLRSSYSRRHESWRQVLDTDIVVGHLPREQRVKLWKELCSDEQVGPCIKDHRMPQFLP